LAFGVFMHRSDSIYNDIPSEQYQFPKQYLGRAKQCVGDWIVYLEPSKVIGSRGYFAIARVEKIIPDPETDTMFLALIEPGQYIQFASPVAFNTATGPVEQGLLNEAKKLSGRAQAAVRPISASDFNRILELGFEDNNPLLPRTNEIGIGSGFEEPQSVYVIDGEREKVERLTTRIVRDRVFRKIVIKAYNERCAITGLKLINGGGRAEVAAAHIRPVEHNGPDVINNGIALSGTAHWMFDRGLISLSDSLEILISRQANDFESIRGFINQSGRAYEPERAKDRPHPNFLKWHRENCFKQ
jgi:putative restriction endonuclease